MQELSHTQPILQPSRTPWFLSIGLFVLMSLVLIGFRGYHMFQQDTIAQIKKDTEALDTSIAESQKDREVIIASILKKADVAPTLNVKELVKNFRSIAAANQVYLKGFTVSKNMVTSTLTAVSPDVASDAVTKVIALMRATKLPGGFTLDPIYSVKGTTEERTTTVKFRILSPNTPANVTK